MNYPITLILVKILLMVQNQKKIKNPLKSELQETPRMERFKHKLKT